MSDKRSGNRESANNKRKQTDHNESLDKTPVTRRLRSASSAGKGLAPIAEHGASPIADRGASPIAEQGASLTTPTDGQGNGGNGKSQQRQLRPSPSQTLTDKSDREEAKRKVDFDDFDSEEEREWTTQEIQAHEEQLLRARQIELVETKALGEAARAKQEAEAHAARERLYKLKEALAERELSRPTESRTQKVPAHLVLKTENCQNVARVAAHLYRLNSEPAKDRLSFLKQGAGDILLTSDQEQMPWLQMVPNVLRGMSPDYLQALHELIIAPRSRAKMTLPDFLTLKHAASTAVTTYRWLSQIEGHPVTEEAGRMTARMILLSLPEDIRAQTKRQLAGQTGKEETLAVITAILENEPEVPTPQQPRYGTPPRRNDQNTAPIQESPQWTAKDVERLVNKAVNDRMTRR